jgi:hypothetical protein
MTRIDAQRPYNAPEAVTGSDGKTALRRFRVDGVIYAPDREEAERRLAWFRLDAARLLWDGDAYAEAELECGHATAGHADTVPGESALFCRICAQSVPVRRLRT